ncbi:MAG: hypothetical protein ACE5DX_06305, partial [Candidatus Dojkabacteria bacterium]
DTAAAVTVFPIGIAGDTRSTGTTSFTPESGSALSRNPKTSLTGALVTGAFGAQQVFTQNRVADQFNEVLASGKMTVYHGGGEFWTDQYELVHANGTTVATYTPGTWLYVGASTETTGTADGEFASVGGRFTDSSTGGVNYLVGATLAAPTAYPSGVPGTDTAFSALPEGGNSLSWGTFLHVLLKI